MTLRNSFLACDAKPSKVCKGVNVLDTGRGPDRSHPFRAIVKGKACSLGGLKTISLFLLASELN